MALQFGVGHGVVRIVNLWNSLPADVVNAKSVNNFKNKIDVHFRTCTYEIDLGLYYQQ